MLISRQGGVMNISPNGEGIEQEVKLDFLYRNIEQLCDTDDGR